MKVMVIVKATKNSEEGVLPSQELLDKMTRYNEELIKAGIMLAGDGLQPSVKGKRVEFKGSSRKVVDGPFAETKELIAGFWIWQVKSMDEALEWVRRCPDPMPGEEGTLEIRPIFEMDDFGENATPEIRDRVAKHEAALSNKSTKITVEATVKAPIDAVWSAWSTPEDIVQWNAASDDWHTTKAKMDLRTGGDFSSRMEAKDGSMGFDFAGTFSNVVKNKLIEYAMGDTRSVRVEFSEGPNGITIRETFDSEPTHSIEQQRQGWQAILDNFKRHVESKKR